RGERATRASDIFSLGLLAHYLLTGKPFSLSEPAQVPARHRRAVDRCLAQRPEDRHSSVLAFRRMLARPSALRRGCSLGAAAPPVDPHAIDRESPYAQKD